jgi:hypothetical protein
LEGSEVLAVGGTQWLTKGMRGVSRHLVEVEMIEIDVKVEVYHRLEILR